MCASNRSNVANSCPEGEPIGGPTGSIGSAEAGPRLPTSDGGGSIEAAEAPAPKVEETDQFYREGGRQRVSYVGHVRGQGLPTAQFAIFEKGWGEANEAASAAGRAVRPEQRQREHLLQDHRREKGTEHIDQ